jgi:hypothetical protein
MSQQNESKKNTAVPVHATKAYGMVKVEFHALLTLTGTNDELTPQYFQF